MNVCTDWYWAEYIDGVMVSATYLYTQCSENPGGGGGGTGDASSSSPPSPDPCGDQGPPPRTPQSTNGLIVNNPPPDPVNPPDGYQPPPPPTAKPCEVLTITNNVKDPCLKNAADKLINNGLTGKIANIINDVFKDRTSVV